MTIRSVERTRYARRYKRNITIRSGRYFTRYAIRGGVLCSTPIQRHLGGGTTCLSCSVVPHRFSGSYGFSA